MPALFLTSGDPLTDSAGNHLKTGQAADRRRVTEVKWSIPDGFKVADEPAELDARLVGEYVYLRWERYGWQLGKITGEITRSTPRLFLKFNYRITWADNNKGPSKLVHEARCRELCTRH